MARAPFKLNKNMKKIIGVVSVAVAMIAATSCQEKIKTTMACIKNVNDSTMVVDVDKHIIVFETKQAKFDNGAVMAGDSVVVRYIGELKKKKAKALLVRLMPKKGTEVDAVYDPSKELKVSEEPMSEGEKEAIKKYVESGR